MQCKCCTYKVSLILAILCIKRDIISKKMFFQWQNAFYFWPSISTISNCIPAGKILNPFFRLPINIINVQLQYFLCFICVFTLCLCFCFTDLIFFLFMTRLAAPHGSTRLKFFLFLYRKFLRICLISEFPLSTPLHHHINTSYPCLTKMSQLLVYY